MNQQAHGKVDTPREPSADDDRASGLELVHLTGSAWCNVAPAEQPFHASPICNHGWIEIVGDTRRRALHWLRATSAIEGPNNLAPIDGEFCSIPFGPFAFPSVVLCCVVFSSILSP